MSTTVLHHDDADGFGAAYACWKHLKGDVTYIPVQYGQPVPEMPAGTDKLFIVDFSYPRAVCDALATLYELVVIDHHKTAAETLFGAEYAIFDLNHSGAVLTWDYLDQDGTTAPTILQYVQDYDLWKFELAESRRINLYISALPSTFEVWDAFSMSDALEGGKAIEMFRDRQIERRMKDVRMTEFRVPQHIDYDFPDPVFLVPTLNATDNISELGNAMCAAYPEAPFSVSYCDRADGKRSYSLRSIGEFDVSAVAKAFGGGGHRNAAGFTNP